jgi:hypothetical protein
MENLANGLIVLFGAFILGGFLLMFFMEKYYAPYKTAIDKQIAADQAYERTRRATFDV